MESNRLKKLEEQFQKDLAEVFREVAQNRWRGLLLSVTNVRITPDLSLARVQVSVFPAKNKQEIVDWLNQQEKSIKNMMVQRFEGRLRKMPELVFYLDETFDREEEIDRILRGGGESPIK